LIFLASFPSLTHNLATFCFFSFGIVLSFEAMSSPGTFVAFFFMFAFFMFGFPILLFCFFFFFFDFLPLSRLLSSFSSISATFFRSELISLSLLTSNGVSAVGPREENNSSKIWSADFIEFSSILLYS